MLSVQTFIFGYGSLFNPKSITLTLGRRVLLNELIPVEVQNCIRLWGLVCEVIVEEKSNEKPVNAVFLDIRRQKGHSVNGVLINVSDQEIEAMDIRETQYERIDVTSDIYPTLQDAKAFTYTGKSDYFVEKYENPKVLDKYQKIISAGLQYWGPKFSERFYQTTQPHDFEVILGSYRFLDDKQNMLTGHYKKI